MKKKRIDIEQQKESVRMSIAIYWYDCVIG